MPIQMLSFLKKSMFIIIYIYDKWFTVLMEAVLASASVPRSIN